MFKRYWMAILMALAGAPALAAPTVHLTAPVDQASYVAPATITLAADAASGDGTIVQVAFYDGQALIGSTTSAPYTLDWPQVGAGTYQLTAVATDSANITSTSAPVTITVTAAAGPAPQVYYIHSDHLNTPRLITDENNHAVWQWDSDPFGTTVADADPGNTGTAFVFNPRFAGQYFDRETGLHYNYYRDYDPNTGRYVQSDPIGLDGGIHTYAYVGGNPLSDIDYYGLMGSRGNAAVHQRANAAENSCRANDEIPPLDLYGTPWDDIPIVGLGVRAGKLLVNAANRAAHELYKNGLRAAMGKPAVTDETLARLMDKLYRPGATIGSGSTAAAVRHELATGQPVGGATHSQKAQDSIVALQDWLRRNPTASSGDRAAAENVIRDLSNALGGR